MPNRDLLLKYKTSTETQATLQNAVELTKEILKKSMGDDLASSLHNQPLNDEQLSSLIAADLRQQLSARTGQ